MYFIEISQDDRPSADEERSLITPCSTSSLHTVAVSESERAIWCTPYCYHIKSMILRSQCIHSACCGRCVCIMRMIFAESSHAGDGRCWKAIELDRWSAYSWRWGVLADLFHPCSETIWCTIEVKVKVKVNVDLYSGSHSFTCKHTTPAFTA